MRGIGRRFWSLVAGMLSVPAWGAQTSEIQFSIPRESIVQSLVDFALQARLSIGYSGVNFGAAQNNEVKGLFQADEALKRLLAGTGLEAVRLDAGTIQIRSAAKTPTGSSDI